MGGFAAAAYLLPSTARAQFSPALPGMNNLGLVPNRAPLRPGSYIALPLGSIRGKGWLLKQLELQRDGLTGHAEELGTWLPALQNSAWTGGTGEEWEKGPYYVKGLVSLAYVLDDADLKAKAKRWIDAILAGQQDNGFFGSPKNNDWWPRMVVTYFMRDYHEATQDPRVLIFLGKYYGYLAQPAYLKQCLGETGGLNWGKARAADEMDTILWLYNRTGDAALLSLATSIRDGMYDWTSTAANDEFLSQEILSHMVNIGQMIKHYGVNEMLDGGPEKAQLMAALDLLDREYDLGMGMPGSTEHLAGRSFSQGYETCSVVEKMLSLETNLRVFGHAPLGDALETLAFNALPACLSEDIHQHVYYTRPNHPNARIGGSGYWEDYPDGLVPSPQSGYPCCCYNFHMGWPKYVQNSWAATLDGGLAALAYGPSEVSAKVGTGTPVTITQDTNYPFEDQIRFTVKPSASVQFPLELRLPAWCEAPQITVAGRQVADLTPGRFVRLDRVWNPGDEVVAQFPSKIKVEQGYLGAVKVERSPLVYSLQIHAERNVVVPGRDGFDRFELAPKTPWNYALSVDPKQPSDSISLQQQTMPENPFSATATPLQLTARARRLPSWKLARNGIMADDPPQSPIQSEESDESITLVPFGAQFLRITWFPLLGTPVPPATSFTEDFARPDWFERWGIYGAGWYRSDNALACRPQRTAKIFALGTAFQDLVYDAQVWAPSQGDAGLMFRASRPGFDGNEFDGYYAGLSTQQNAVLLGKCNGNWTELKRAPFPLKPDQPYQMRISASGPHLSVYVADMNAPLLQVEDHDYTQGSIGLRLAAPHYVATRFGPLFARAE